MTITFTTGTLPGTNSTSSWNSKVGRWHFRRVPVIFRECRVRCFYVWGVCLKLCSISIWRFFWPAMNFATPRCWCCFVSNEPFSDGVVFSWFFRIHDVETCIPIIANFLIWHCKTGRANVKNTRFQEFCWFSSFIFLPSCINSTYWTQFSGPWWRAMNILRTQCCAKNQQQIIGK